MHPLLRRSCCKSFPPLLPETRAYARTLSHMCTPIHICTQVALARANNKNGSCHYVASTACLSLTSLPLNAPVLPCLLFFVPGPVSFSSMQVCRSDVVISQLTRRCYSGLLSPARALPGKYRIPVSFVAKMNDSIAGFHHFTLSAFSRVIHPLGLS